jgi:NAD(P)H-dependent FMN reductase
MHITLVSGSHRPDSQSARVAHYLAGQIEKDGHSTHIVDLGKNPLPFWDEDLWADELPAGWGKVLSPVTTQLDKSDAVIVIAPEWAGMVPAALKNFFLLVGDALMHKAGLIVGVSSGINGAYPIAELRSSSYKNTKICYMPDHLIVRTVGDMLHDKPELEQSSHDKGLRERITYTLNVLYEYAKALKTVRASGVTETEKFRYGM